MTSLLHLNKWEHKLQSILSSHFPSCVQLPTSATATQCIETKSGHDNITMTLTKSLSLVWSSRQRHFATNRRMELLLIIILVIWQFVVLQLNWIESTANRSPAFSECILSDKEGSLSSAQFIEWMPKLNLRIVRWLADPSYHNRFIVNRLGIVTDLHLNIVVLLIIRFYEGI